MDNDIFSISLKGSDGLKVWELDDVPQPNIVNNGTAYYYGQKRVEHLLRAINSKTFTGRSDLYLDQFCTVFRSSLEQGVKEEGIVMWDDRSFYLRTSWTGYSWKLPIDIKRRMVQIDIIKLGGDRIEGTIRTPLKKVAEDGSVILISPKMASKMNLKKGNTVSVSIRFCG